MEERGEDVSAAAEGNDCCGGVQRNAASLVFPFSCLFSTKPQQPAIVFSKSLDGFDLQEAMQINTFPVHVHACAHCTG